MHDYTTALSTLEVATKTPGNRKDYIREEEGIMASYPPLLPGEGLVVRVFLFFPIP